MAHTHGANAAYRSSPGMRRILLTLLAPMVLATVVGLVWLWPGDSDKGTSEAVAVPDDLVEARVVAVERRPCAGSAPGGGSQLCSVPTVLLLEGPDEGATIELTEQSEGSGSVVLEPGDPVVLSYFADVEEEFQYAFADLERRRPLYLLAGLFAVAVILLGRLQGVRALIGLTITLAVVTQFILPAILAGGDALAVALTGSAVIALVGMYLAHGLNVRTTTAVLGTLFSLALVGVLAVIFVGAARFTGLATEEALLVQISATDLNLRGLLLGGIIIGSLGVLDDVTVTQVSAVWELRGANATFQTRDLYRAGIRIGRDHIASTVNTLVLAYAGASLPLLLLFTQADQGLLDVINSETVAVEIVRTLAGSIGLVASVPITTALAAVVVSRARTSTGRRFRRPGEPHTRSRREERFWSDPT